MIDIKADFSGGLNLDDAIYNVPKNSYIDAENITTDAIAGANDKAITNIVGNQLVNYTLPAGINVCIGAYPNNVRNTVIYFVWNSNDNHLILEYDNNFGTISPIFENLVDSAGIDILNFDRNKKITSINVYNRNPSFDEGDLLFFIDSLGRPTGIDIERFRIKEYNPVTRDIIDVCKKPPLFPPLNIYVNDTNRKTNTLRNRLFRFKYRYVYDNNEKSVCSPIGSVPLPVRVTDEAFVNDPEKNNRIDLTLNTGDKDVKAVELLMSYVRGTNDWSDFGLVETIDKEDLFLKSKVIVVENNPLDTAVEAIITFSGAPIDGTIITLTIKEIITNNISTIGTYTVQNGDTLANITAGLVASLNLSGFIGTVTNPTLDTISFYFDGAIYLFNNSLISIVIPTNASIDNIPFPYSFYNDGTYPIIDVQESIQLFDYVPDLANAQEMANGNVLIYGGITEGYDRNITPNVVNTILTKNPTGGQTNGLSGYVTIIPNTLAGQQNNVAFRITVSGMPIQNTVINVYIKDNGVSTLAATYTTLIGDSTDTIIRELYDSFVALGKIYQAVKLGAPVMTQMNVYLNAGDTYESLQIINSNASNNSVPTFLFSTKRRIGIAYFDKKGKTNGILYSGDLEFPPYNENITDVLLPYIKTEIYHTPPDWAYSYGFYLTKEATQFLYWKSIALKSDTNYWYFDISNLTETQQKFPTKAAVLSYTFQDGDRIRLIKNETSGTIYNEKWDSSIEGVVVNPSGISPNGTYVKVKKTTQFTGLSDTSYIIQLYRPAQQSPNDENEVYYEFGQQYEIGLPETPNRYHKGMLLNQGVLPSSPIRANVATTTFGSGGSITRYSFGGTPVPGTVIQLNITDQVISSQILLASYTVDSNDTVNDIVTQLYNILNASPLKNIIYSNLFQSSPTDFEFTYSSTFIVGLNDTVFTYPQLSQLPAVFEFTDGDVYYRLRTLVGASSAIGTMKAIDRNFVDDYISAVNSVDGRPSVIDINARKAYYSTLVRFGQAYQPNTNINGLNRFFPANFDEYDYSYGDIMRLKVRDRFIRVFQKLKVGKVPLYSQIVKDPSNVQNLIVSDKLINPISYYVGDLGIGEHAESLASYNYADYFTSNIKGIIARVGEEGVSFLSIDHKVDSWAAMKLPLRTGNFKVYGGLDQILGNYIITLESIPNVDEAYTLVYDVNSKIFSTFFSYHPEMMVTLATVFISFKNGQLYTHDNPNYNTFFGQPAADSSVTLAFNANPLDKKTFMSVGEVASQIWDVPQIQTDINSFGNVKMESNLVDADFNELEGTYEAPILRDVNSIGGILEGDSMKGKYMTMKFRAKAPTSLVSLNLLSLKSINSPLNNR